MSVKLKIEPYKKAALVTGEHTYTYKDRLKEKGGKWNRTLRGWIFPGSKLESLRQWHKELEEELKQKVKVAADKTAPPPPNKTRLIEPDPDKDTFKIVDIKKTKPGEIIKDKGEIIIDLRDKEDKESKKKQVSVIPDIEPLPVSPLKRGLIDASYFVNDKIFKKYKSHINRQMGWLLYLRSKFPDMCLVYDKKYDDYPFQFFPIKHQNIRVFAESRARKGERDENVVTAQTKTGYKRYRAHKGYVIRVKPLPKFAYDTSIYMASWVPQLFAKCLIQGSRIIVMIFVIGSGAKRHENALIYNRDNRTLYRFEPHGGQLTYYNSNKVDQDIQKIINYTPIFRQAIDLYQSPYDFCPKPGPQALEGQYKKTVTQKIREFGGYCSVWTILFIHSILANPHLPIEAVAYDMMDEPKELYNRIREYTAFIMRMDKKLDYLYQERSPVSSV